MKLSLEEIINQRFISRLRRICNDTARDGKERGFLVSYKKKRIIYSPVNIGGCDNLAYRDDQTLNFLMPIVDVHTHPNNFIPSIEDVRSTIIKHKPLIEKAILDFLEIEKFAYSEHPIKIIAEPFNYSRRKSRMESRLFVFQLLRSEAYLSEDEYPSTYDVNEHLKFLQERGHNACILRFNGSSIKPSSEVKRFYLGLSRVYTITPSHE